jgi:hypothetical protein
MAARTRRVFLSHTSELRDHPREGSFVAAAQSAVGRAGNVAMGMAYFTAQDKHSSDYCRETVERAEIYVGVIGLRYGSVVSDQPDLSYTELEFAIAGEVGLPRLVFLLDRDAVLPLPASLLIDREFGHRQDSFRRRLRDAGLTFAYVVTPTQLELALYQALVELAQEDGAIVQGGSVEVPLGRLPMEVRGREETLHLLQERRGLVVLAGLGGVGKSTVAAELARRVRSQRPLPHLDVSCTSSDLRGMRGRQEEPGEELERARGHVAVRAAVHADLKSPPRSSDT